MRLRELRDLRRLPFVPYYMIRNAQLHLVALWIERNRTPQGVVAFYWKYQPTTQTEH